MRWPKKTNGAFKFAGLKTKAEPKVFGVLAAAFES
jgi:hypothetical protein